jgi:hypothetical protein
MLWSKERAIVTFAGNYFILRKGDIKEYNSCQSRIERYTQMAIAYYNMDFRMKMTMLSASGENVTPEMLSNLLSPYADEIQLASIDIEKVELGRIEFPWVLNDMMATTRKKNGISVETSDTCYLLALKNLPMKCILSRATEI